MILDATLSFVPVGGNLSLVGAPDTDIPSTNTIDLLGEGVGTPSSNIIGNRSTFGEDSGLGAVKPQVQVIIGTQPVSGAGPALLNVQFQAAADDGTNHPDTWMTLVETGNIALSELPDDTVCARFDWPPAFPPGLQPRFLRLNFTGGGAAGAYFSAGVVSSATVTMVRDDQANKYMPNNYVAAGA